MKPPLVRRIRRLQPAQHKERGVTLVLVAVAMIAMIAMAALSIDLVTLYLAKEEAQRSADLAALAAARVLSLTGVTGDPNNTPGSVPIAPWPAACTVARQLATTVANQNAVGGNAATTVNVTFLYNGTPTDCTFAFGGGFAVNPQVQVQVIRQGLPVFFSRIWSRATKSVSATAIAEAFNPSGSSTYAPGGIVPVNPRCVKPWLLPNLDPGNGDKAFVKLDGSIGNPGIRNGTTGVIGESFQMKSACTAGAPDCSNMEGVPPAARKYIPSLVSATAAAVPSCANNNVYQEAIGGCDQSTVYACGTPNGGQADLTINPGGSTGDTAIATQCLIDPQSKGPDTMDYTTTFPFQISAGAGNPVVQSGLISASSSIVTVPIYEAVILPPKQSKPSVTIVGFLQVFIDSVNPSGPTGAIVNVHVLNIAGCSNTATNTPVNGSSPVPTRLITPQ